MSVKVADIKVGSVLYPTNYSGIRKVMRIVDDGDAFWYGYDRDTGVHARWDYGLCSLTHLARWAERFATIDEIDMIQTQELKALRSLVFNQEK